MGFEPTTHSLEGCCSIQLSYGHTTYIKCFLVQVKSSTSCEYDVYLATPCHCSCVLRAAKIGCEKSIYFRKYYIETYLTPFASALIMIVKLLYLLSPICRLKGKDYLMYRRLMFNFLQYIDTVCLYKTSSTSRFLSK